MTPGHFDKALVSLTAPASFAAEQYQALRLKLERLREARDIRVLAISSPSVGDGKTVTSINLACALARGATDRVLLIDADFRRPAIGRHLGIDDPNTLGFAQAIADERLALHEVTLRPEWAGFSVILGTTAPQPAQDLLRSARLGQLLQQARHEYDFVVLDTPPLIPVCDATLLARAVDGMLIVVSAHATPRKLLEESLNLLDESKVLGIVLNGDTKPLFGYYDAYQRTRSPRRATAARFS